MRASDLAQELDVLRSCLTAVRDWYLSNNLLLNANKSQAIVLGTANQLRSARSTPSKWLTGTDPGICVRGALPFPLPFPPSLNSFPFLPPFPSLPFPSPPFPSFPLPSSSLPSYPHRSLPSPPLRSRSPVLRLGDQESAQAPPAGPGGARPPNGFW